MSSEQPESHGRRRTSRGRLTRSGRSLVRVGGILLVISLVVTLVGGLTTRSLLDNLSEHSAELIDGSATLTLPDGADRALYVTGGLVAPGEDVPTPVEEITCTVTGPSGAVPVEHLSDEGRQVGLDNPLARFQVVGSFQAAEGGEHTISCSGLGVVVAPQVSPAGALLRLGALMLGSLGTFAGATMVLLGGGLLLSRLGVSTEADDEYEVEDERGEPPARGAERWWEDETTALPVIRLPRDQGQDGDADTDDEADDQPADDAETDEADEAAEADKADEVVDDDYVELTDEELASLSDEEIAEMLASGSLVFVDDTGKVVREEDEPLDQDEQRDTYR